MQVVFVVGGIVSEFRIPLVDDSTRHRDRKIRLILWGLVLALLGITLFAVCGARAAGPILNTTLACVAVLIVMGVFVGANILGLQLGLDKLEHDLVFILTDRELVRRRAGWPDTRIELSDVTSIQEGAGWLVVRGAKPQSRIAIPEKVEDFVLLRTELAKHGAIAKPTRRSSSRIIWMAASLVCWLLVLWSRNPSVVRIAGSAGLVILGAESYRLASRLRHTPKRYFLWTALSISWVAVLLLVYLAVFRR
jgi:FtsH-binding integral membrane protein